MGVLPRFGLAKDLVCQFRRKTYDLLPGWCWFPGTGRKSGAATPITPKVAPWSFRESASAVNRTAASRLRESRCPLAVREVCGLACRVRDRAGTIIRFQAVSSRR